jgi:hypothetical protein
MVDTPRLLHAIEQRELRAIDQQLRAGGSGLQQVNPAGVTEFVTRSLSVLRQLLYSDVTQARELSFYGTCRNSSHANNERQLHG